MQTAPALQSLSNGVAHFLDWWRDELKGLVPDSVQRFVVQHRAEAVLAPLDGGFLVIDRNFNGELPAWASPALLPRTEAISKLADVGKSNPASAIGIRLPLGLCFVRQVELPSAARSDLRQILDFDLERATPFKLRDVYTAHLVDGIGSAEGKLRVRHLIIKRGAVDPLVAEVRAAGLDVEFVDCWNEQQSAGLPIDFMDSRADAARGMSRLLTPIRVLAALASILIISAVALTLWVHESALAQLQAQTAQARTQATAVRQVLERSDAAVADLARLQDMKLKQVAAIEVMEEVARVLPDTAWLSDFRIEGDTLDVSGLAKAGAALPPMFERSAILADGALSAPLTLDQREDKERFSLRLRIRNQTVSREPSITEKQN